MRLRRRSATTGEFVSSAVAAAHPESTVTERVKPPSTVATWARVLCEALAENGDLEVMSAPSVGAYDYLREALGLV